MHIASKITLLIGIVMLIGSGISMGTGVGDLAGAGEERTYIDDESSGTFTINENESWNIQVYILHPVDCESVELTIVDSGGNDVLGDKYGCSYEYYEDDEMYEYAEGERQIFASISHEQSGMKYTLNSNVEVDIDGTYCDEACIDSALGGVFAAVGGLMGICCSVLVLVLGIILALTLDDNKISSTMQSGQMTTGQVAYQTPVSGQVSYQTPVTTQVPMAQTFNPNPVSQVIQPSAVPVTPITPPLTQQPPVEQVTQPVAVPVTPITPPTTQQPSVGQETQPEKSAWWGEEPQQ
ncbi:MAG: hypothetical protein QNL81_05825 [Euryarchaeota archaeon]